MIPPAALAANGPAPLRRQLATIQYLRALSAAAIVLFHISVHYGHSIHVGEARIALFFIVSGFVFALITMRRPGRPREFLSRRLARIVPLYWGVTTLLFVAQTLGMTRRAGATIDEYILSLLFLPHLDASGRVFPLLIPGWTLVYEMFFCLTFAALLCLPDRLRLRSATLVYGGLGLYGCLALPIGPLAHTYTNPILLEFLGGLWLAYGWARLQRHVDRRGAWALVAIGVLLSLLRTPYDDTPLTVIISGIPAMMMVIGALGLEQPQRQPIGWMKAIGDAAYSIYLWHVPVLVITARLLERIGIHNAALTIPLAFAACLVAGLLLYRLVEKPVTDTLFAWLDRRSAARRSSQAAVPVARDQSRSEPSVAARPAGVAPAPELPSATHQ